jgi:hypothetical protein
MTTTTTTETITDHHDGFGLAESIVIEKDEPGPGGASHRYRFVIDGTEVASVQFQRGPRHEEGSTPGVIEGDDGAMMLDRLRAFQAGPYACRENALALTKLEEALMWMQQRARARAKRGVLGTVKT